MMFRNRNSRSNSVMSILPKLSHDTQSRVTHLPGQIDRRNRPYPQKGRPVPIIPKKQIRLKPFPTQPQDVIFTARNLAIAAGICVLVMCAVSETSVGSRRRLPRMPWLSGFLDRKAAYDRAKAAEGAIKNHTQCAKCHTELTEWIKPYDDASKCGNAIQCWSCKKYPKKAKKIGKKHSWYCYECIVADWDQTGRPPQCVDCAPCDKCLPPGWTDDTPPGCEIVYTRDDGTTTTEKPQSQKTKNVPKYKCAGCTEAHIAFVRKQGLFQRSYWSWKPIFCCYFCLSFKTCPDRGYGTLLCNDCAKIASKTPFAKMSREKATKTLGTLKRILSDPKHADHWERTSKRLREVEDRLHELNGQ